MYISHCELIKFSSLQILRFVFYLLLLLCALAFVFLVVVSSFANTIVKKCDMEQALTLIAKSVPKYSTPTIRQVVANSTCKSSVSSIVRKEASNTLTPTPSLRKYPCHLRFVRMATAACSMKRNPRLIHINVQNTIIRKGQLM